MHFAARATNPLHVEKHWSIEGFIGRTRRRSLRVGYDRRTTSPAGCPRRGKGTEQAAYSLAACWATRSRHSAKVGKLAAGQSSSATVEVYALR